LAASDLHIEPWEDSIAVRARVNGVLTEVAHLPLDLLDKISMRFQGDGQPGDLPGGLASRWDGDRWSGTRWGPVAGLHLSYHSR